MTSFPCSIDAENGNGDTRIVRVSNALAGHFAHVPGAAYLSVPGRNGALASVWLSPESTKALSEALAEVVALGAPAPEPEPLAPPAPTVFEPGTRVRIATDATFGPGFTLTEAARGSVGVVLEGPDPDDDYFVGGIEDFGGRSQWVAGASLTAEPEPVLAPAAFTPGTRVLVADNPTHCGGLTGGSAGTLAGKVVTVTSGPDGDGDYYVDGGLRHVFGGSLTPAPEPEPEPEVIPDPEPPLFEKGARVVVLDGARAYRGRSASDLPAGTIGTIEFGPDSDGDYFVAAVDPITGDDASGYVDAFSLVPAPVEEPEPLFPVGARVGPEVDGAGAFAPEYVEAVEEPEAPRTYAVGDKVTVACYWRNPGCSGPATVVAVEGGTYRTQPDAGGRAISHSPDELTPAPVEEEPTPEPAPLFSAGDVVELQPKTRTYSAKPGALALVTEDYPSSGGWLHVKWLSASASQQNDGAYAVGEFTPATLTGRLAEVTEREPWTASLLPGDVVKIVSEPHVSLEGELAVGTTGASAWAREQGTRAWTLSPDALKIVD